MIDGTTIWAIYTKGENILVDSKQNLFLNSWTITYLKEKKEEIPIFWINWVFDDHFNKNTNYKKIKLWKNVNEFELRYIC